MVLRTCPVAPWLVDPRGYLVVYEGHDVTHYQLATQPQGFQSLSNTIAQAIGLQCKPSVFFVEDAVGKGGFAYGNLIVVGREDQKRIVDTAWRQNVRPLRNSTEELIARRNGQRIVRKEQLNYAALQYVLAHEYGHARQFELDLHFQSEVERELDADRIAGWVAAHFGFDETLGRMIAFSVGCTSQYCAHGSPLARLAAYQAGGNAYRQQLFQAAFGWLMRPVCAIF